jgi:uncharacterized protein YjbJ (UPF0337 family)
MATERPDHPKGATIMGAGTSDKAEGKLDELKGNAKQTFSSNPDTQAEGAAQEAKGKGKQTWGDVKNTGQKIKDRFTKH